MQPHNKKPARFIKQLRIVQVFTCIISALTISPLIKYISKNYTRLRIEGALVKQHLVDLYSTSGTFKMLLSTPGFIEETIISQGHWEPHLSNTLCDCMWNGGVFLDIGANIGYHSLFVATACPQATCIGYEPHPKLAEQFERNILINSLSNINLRQAAVGNTTGSIPFNMQMETGKNHGLSSILYYDYMDTAYQQINVPIIRLDHDIDPAIMPNVKVIKIDTQGYEYEVLLGAQRIIQEFQPIICLEYHDHPANSLEDIYRLLPNYTIYRLFSWKGGIKLYDVNDPEMYIEDVDLLCVPTTAE